MIKRLGIGFVLTLFSGLALAGIWNTTYSIVGGAAYCASYIGTRCSVTVPAGPANVTGNETVPADTNLSGGSAQPQTVLLSMASLNALPIDVVAVTTASPSGISATNISGGVLYNATGTITAANITLPLAPADKQRYIIAANYTITTLSVAAGAGSTLSVTTPTVLTASTTVPQGYEYMYDLASLKWFRLR